MRIIPNRHILLSILVLPISLATSSGYAFSNAEANKLMKYCIDNTQKQYGYSLQLSREYCHCGVSRTIAYMKKHNLKEGVKPPPGTDKEAIGKAFIDISVQCAREILTR
jgi:hypothetical protein